jgi:hypothetical protein
MKFLLVSGDILWIAKPVDIGIWVAVYIIPKLTG